MISEISKRICTSVLTTYNLYPHKRKSSDYIWALLIFKNTGGGVLIYRGGYMKKGTYQKRPTAHLRPEEDPARRSLYDKNKKIILATQNICGICGQPVDKSLKYPHPFSPTVDHIIPCNKGGSDELDNLQLAHRRCNRLKSDKMPEEKSDIKDANKNLPQSVNWRTF